MENKEEVWIGNDHGGFQLKLQIIEWLKQKGISYKDIGCNSEDIVRYPYYASKIAGAVSKNVISRGILICSTGIGMSIIANKYKGVRASLCTSAFMAKMTRAHNNSNLLCLGGKITPMTGISDIMENWINTEYEGGRHNISLGLIEEAENINFNAGTWEPNFEG